MNKNEQVWLLIHITELMNLCGQMEMSYKFLNNKKNRLKNKKMIQKNEKKFSNEKLKIK